MGTIIQENFGRVGDLILDMADGRKWNLYQLLQHCDDDTWEFYDGDKNRQNRIGAHIFKSKNQFGIDRGKVNTSSVDPMFDAWIKSGWIRDANSVPDLKDDPTYLRHYGHLPEKQRPVHYVFNVYWLCNLLDLRATMKAYKITDPRHELVLPLLPLALKPNEEKFLHPPVKSFLGNYKPRVIPDFPELVKEGPPDRWENWDDLFPEKENSAGEGAGAKVEKQVISEGIGNPEERLSVTDHIITADEFAKLIEEIFPRNFAFDYNGSDEIVTFQKEHINRDGYLDIHKTGLPMGLIVAFEKSPAAKELKNYNAFRQENLLAIRNYMINQDG